MTPKERAEKIPLWLDYDVPGRKEETYRLIADEIQSAVEEANHTRCREFDEEILSDIDKVRAEALEEAAKLFEQTCHCPEQGLDCEHGDAPASRIRALIPKDKP